MKKSQLRQIIKEEISRFFEEEKPNGEGDTASKDKEEDKCSKPEQEYLDKAKKVLEANKEAWGKSSEEEKKKYIFQTAVMYCMNAKEGKSSEDVDNESDLGTVGDYDSFFECDKDEFKKFKNPEAALRRCQKNNKRKDSIIGSPSQWGSLISKIKSTLKLEENTNDMKKTLLTERFQKLAGITPLYAINSLHEDEDHKVNTGGGLDEEDSNASTSGMTISGKPVDVMSFKVGGVDKSQGPDDGTSDAYFEAASFEGGMELNAQQLGELNDRYPKVAIEYAIDNFHNIQEDSMGSFFANGEGPYLDAKNRKQQEDENI